MEPVADPVVLDPGYRQLYYRWERQQWAAGAIDLSEDRRQWVEVFPIDFQRAFSWSLSSFKIADEITTMLVPFVDAAPSEEQQVFLTTQLADSARHTVFYDRFDSEVLADGAALAPRPGWLNEGCRILTTEMLPAASEAIANDLGNMGRFVEGVALYHLVIEGTVAFTGRRFLLDHVHANDLLSGFRRGSTAIALDEVRHVDFAMRFLRAMIVKDRHYAEVIRDVITRAVPVVRAAFEPPGGDLSYLDPFSYGPGDLTTFALDSLEKNARAIGLEVAP